MIRDLSESHHFFKFGMKQYGKKFGKNKNLLTLRYQTYEGFPQWGQFFQNNF